MVNLAEKHEEDSSAQLADAEISRILTALQKAEFKRSESGNARPDQTFKPRSLMEIAETALKQDEAAKAAEMATADTAPQHTKNQPDQINLDDDRQGPNSATATDTADPAMHVAAMPTGWPLAILLAMWIKQAMAPLIHHHWVRPNRIKGPRLAAVNYRRQIWAWVQMQGMRVAIWSGGGTNIAVRNGTSGL